MQEVTLVGIDLGKHSFHLHGQDRHGNAVFRRKVGRKQLVEFFVSATVHRSHGILCRRALHGPQAGDVWTQRQTDLTPVRAPVREEQQESMVLPVFATLTFNVVVGLLESIRRLEGDDSPRHDESRAQRTSE